MDRREGISRIPSGSGVPRASTSRVPNTTGSSLRTPLSSSTLRTPLTSSTLGKRAAGDAGLRDDPGSVRKSLASSQARSTNLERRVLELERAVAEKNRLIEELRDEGETLRNERHLLYESEKKEKNESDARRDAWAQEKAEYEAKLSRYRGQATKVSSALEEYQSKYSSLQRNYSRVVRDVEEKEALFGERIKSLETERDSLRGWEQRSRALVIEVEEWRRKAEAKRDDGGAQHKTDDGMRHEMRRQSQNLQSQQSKIDQLNAELLDLRRWKKETDARDRQTLEEKAKLRRHIQLLEDEVNRLRRERDSLTQTFSGSANDEVVSLQNQLATLDQLHKELAEKHTNTKLRLEEEIARAAKLSNDTTATILEYERRVKDLERQERNALEGQRFAEARAAGLRREVDAARASGSGSGDSAERVRALESTVEEYKAQLDELQAESRDVEARIAQGAGLVKVAELEAAHDRVTQLEKDAKELQQTVDDLSKANTTLDAEVSELMLRVASGEYNPERERCLELRSNPAAKVQTVRKAQLEDLRTENAALLDRLKQLDTTPTPSDGGVGLVPRSSYDRLAKEREEQQAAHEKRLLRLKEIFGLKSREFLEAVYSLLGWRIRFEENGGELRLTSMYAPKGKMGLTLKFTSHEGHFGTMAMSGAMARGLEEAHQFWVVERQSIPGFLAQVTTEMFEKTTIGRAAGYVGLGVE